ncbi:NAD(P)-dependent oxidoreductase [Treponema berlinense]|uniref:NAD(P)-dependent oxidoreductase n=1 Tax=Treponema berlinense TaxID=225004 RepID=UPI001F44AD1E|nr:NAD(P)-dependent oxidoreductase [Treponema berlinense]
MGIFGYGNIGKKVSEIGKAFGMKVICCTRTEKPGMPEMVSREELINVIYPKSPGIFPGLNV